VGPFFFGIAGFHTAVFWNQNLFVELGTAQHFA
jgi:hypothetical protein